MRRISLFSRFRGGKPAFRCPLRHAAGVAAALLVVWAATHGLTSSYRVFAMQEEAPQHVSDPVRPLIVDVDLKSLEEAAGREARVPGGGLRTVPEGEPLPDVPPPVNEPISDPTVQIRAEDLASEAIGLISDPDVNVAGITSFANPPDTVGDVGRSHFVQMVNATQFQIWNKDGVALTGPLSFGALWPVGNVCRNNAGDPIVVYDHLADRWLLSQFAFPNHMCIAISQTPDPTAGSWFLYTFNVLVFPDYPKIGVWPDGYYMSSFEGATLGVFVFDRINMLLGNAASFMKATLPSLAGAAPGVRETRILPSDLDGPPPPLGTPNFFVRTVDHQQHPANPIDRIEVYEFNVDWATLSFTFTLVDTLRPAPFNIMVCNRNGGGVRDCIPEPDTTATVDALSNRPMMQLKFRNFGFRHTLVFNQTIDVRGSIPNSLGIIPTSEVAGIRWYELRRAGTWGIFQQGTYAPQPLSATAENQLLHRWMGSAAMDNEGNIALGYSIVNDDDANDVFPGIRYTGRRFDDPLDLMPQGEKTLLNGTNSQTGGFGLRWGDYSALSVDPVDDCTFWYTNHVAGIGGTGGRPTRIGSFRFDTCGLDLSLRKTAFPSPVIAGDLLTYSLSVTNNSSFSATNVKVIDVLPSGVTYLADTDACVQAPVGTLTCTLGSMAPGEFRTFNIQVRVHSNLVASANGAITITNLARVTADEPDSDPSNNTASVATIVNDRANLRLIKDCKPDLPLRVGRTATCTIFVDNLGPSTARSVVVTDTHLSDGLFNILSATFTPPAESICSVGAGVVTCQLGTEPAGGRTTIRVRLTSRNPVGVNDIATVESATPDPDVDNNSDQDSVQFKKGNDDSR